jgi:hypothetical protein
MNFADLIELPDSRRLVVCEHYPAMEVEGLEWTATEGGSHYAEMTDGEIIEVLEAGAEYAEVFSAADCDATASTFFMDLENKRLYLHTSTGVIPSHQTGGVYDFCILAYFIIGFSDRMDSSGKDPVFEPEIEKLLDGGLEDWTDATALAHWTKSESSGSSISREETEVHSGAYAAKFTVDAGDLWFERMEYATDAEAQAAYVNEGDTIGGVITHVGGYRIHTFYESGTFQVLSGSVDVEVLVVAGGGGGGGDGPGEGATCAGGGGGGGLLYDDAYSATGSIPVTVGEGGEGGAKGDRYGWGDDGEDSVFGTMTAIGGGAGGGYIKPGKPGGSGGGGGLKESAAGGVGTVGQGHDGGDSEPANTHAYYAGGGGGGADEAGADGVEPSIGGKGGDGLEYFGSYYSGGGGGGAKVTAGLGGLGGGGNGSASTGAANSGTPNTGGGGGGARRDGAGGKGGKGIVIIRIADIPSLESYSEAAIKQEGDYSLKGVALIATSLNKTLIRTISTPINLTDINTIKFDIRASRTGSNIKVGIHDSGGTTTETTPNIVAADTWQTITWDISGVSNANKDAIDTIIITVVNAGAANTFYIDKMYLPSAHTGALSLSQTGIILRPECKCRSRFRLKSTVASPGVMVKWGIQDSAGNVWYNATAETWGAETYNEASGITSAGWTEVAVDFPADDGYSNYKFIVKTGTVDRGEVYSFYLDDCSLIRILKPMPYRAIIPQGGAPQITQSVGDYYIGDVVFSAGEIRYGNDGWWYEALVDYIWHLKKFWLKAGAIDSDYSELGTLFWGRTSRPVVTDREATFEVVDAREGLFGSIPSVLFDLTTYPNMDPEEVKKARAIPILFGELDNITPICIDTTIWKYKIAGHELEEISAVYKDGVTLTLTTDYTVDLANGEFTLVADPENGVITCKAKGAKCKIQDGTYSAVGADILFAALTTFNSPAIPKSQIDLVSFLDLQANRIQPLAAYLTDQAPVLDFVRKIQDSNVFHLIPLANRTFGAFRYAVGTTGSEVRIDQHDFASFALRYDTAPVRKTVIIKYGQDPTTKNWLAEKVTDANIGYRYDQAEILEKETLLTVASDSATLGQFYLNIIRSPEKRVSGTVPALLLGHRPAEKIFVSKSIRDGEGVTQTILAEEVYRALTLVKNAGPATVEVEAVLDIQSTGAMHNNISHVDTHSDSHTDVLHVDEHGDGDHGDKHADVVHSNSYSDNPYDDHAHVDVHNDAHTDIEHTDTHGDAAYTDTAHGNAGHSDNPHEDIPHTDGAGHSDSPHVDSHSDMAHQDFYKDIHVDDDTGLPYRDSHGDSYNDSHRDSHSDTPHGDSAYVDVPHENSPHEDLSHTNTAYVDSRHTDVHANTSHTDVHTNNHGDTHTDVPPEDRHYDRAYRDYHADGGHDDTAHEDVIHEDVAHVNDHGNIAHGDSEY